MKTGFFFYFCDMKKLLLAGVLMLVASGSIFAQNYTPLDTWPFLYQDFLPGMTRVLAGGTLTEAKFNITVNDSRLVYISNDDRIMQLDMKYVYSAKVGDDVFVNILGKMYKLISELDCGYVLEETTVDIDKMNQVEIGYGITSSSASANNLTLLLDGRFNLVNGSAQQAISNKYNGSPIPTIVNLYIYADAHLIPASRQGVSSYPGIDRKAARDFFKQEKIKWKDVSSLEKVLVFVHSQLSENK